MSCSSHIFYEFTNERTHDIFDRFVKICCEQLNKKLLSSMQGRNYFKRFFCQCSYEIWLNFSFMINCDYKIDWLTIIHTETKKKYFVEVLKFNFRIKVHIFWEGHKTQPLLVRKTKINWEILSYFCALGLLITFESY